MHNFPPERAAASVSTGTPCTRRIQALSSAASARSAPPGRSPDTRPTTSSHRRGRLLTAHASRGEPSRFARAGSRWRPHRRLPARDRRPRGARSGRESGRGRARRRLTPRRGDGRAAPGLVWLAGEAEAAEPGTADRAHLDARAAEIAGGVAMNPYYRCFEAADGFLAVACLNLTQRRAFLAVFEFDDRPSTRPTSCPTTRRSSRRRRSSRERSHACSPRAGRRVDRPARGRRGAVRCGAVARVGVRRPAGRRGTLIGRVPARPRDIDLLAPFVRVEDGGRPRAAPVLGADTEAVLGSSHEVRRPDELATVRRVGTRGDRRLESPASPSSEVAGRSRRRARGASRRRGVGGAMGRRARYSARRLPEASSSDAPRRPLPYRRGDARRAALGRRQGRHAHDATRRLPLPWAVSGSVRPSEPRPRSRSTEAARFWSTSTAIGGSSPSPPRRAGAPGTPRLSRTSPGSRACSRARGRPRPDTRAVRTRRSPRFPPSSLASPMPRLRRTR